MARRKLNFIGTMPSATASEAVSCDVRGIDYASVACYSRDGTWNASLVVTLEVSQDGDQWYTAQYLNSADGTTTSVSTFTANGVKRLIPVFDVMWIRARVTTAGGTTTIVVNFYGEGEDDGGSVSGKARGTTAIGGGATGGSGGGTGGGGTPDSGTIGGISGE